VTTFADALSAYRLCARAEGKSPKTVTWIVTGVGYFGDFLGPERQDLATITGNDLRRFIIELQQTPKYRRHPCTRPMAETISLQSIETYARAVRAFFGFLHRESLIETNPMQWVKLPLVPEKVVPTLSEKEVLKLLAQPDKSTGRGFRDYALMLILLDTAARVSEVATARYDDVDLENGYLRVMGKGAKERFIPMGRKVAMTLLKYRLKHRPQATGTDRFWLTVAGGPLEAGRIEKIVANAVAKPGSSGATRISLDTLHALCTCATVATHFHCRRSWGTARSS
jgi:site-specific recombinase XerD